MTKQKKLPFHYGWLIVASGMLLAGAGSGIFGSTIGVFVKPVCEKYGFARASFMIYSTIYFIVNVLMMPLFGSLFQKYSYKKIALLCSVVLAGCMFTYSFADQLWMFYAISFVIGLFINGISMMAIGVLVNRWFEDSRGLAAGLAFSGSGILAAILMPVCTSMIETNGIAPTYRFLALVSLFISVPVLLFVVKDRPEDIGLTPYRKGEQAKAAAMPEVGLSRAEALRRPEFWLLFLAIITIAVCQAGPNTNNVSILADIGHSASFAAAVSSYYMVLLTIVKIVIGRVFDKLGSLKGSLIISSSCAIFPLFALLSHTVWAPFVYVSFMAIAASGCTVLGSFLAGDFFGRKHYASIYSIISAGTQLGAAISSPMIGLIYDTTGDYTLAWCLIICLGLIVCGMLTLGWIFSRKNKVHEHL